MSYIPKILAFAGSAREASFNKKLARIAAESARKAGAEVMLIDLRDFPMPIMDQDLEAREGLPPNARKFKELILQSDGLIIAAPEYNSSITPLLKNALDWASRAEQPNEGQLAAFRGKFAAIMSASPGALGGLRGLVVLRSMLGNSGVWVSPSQLAVGKAHEAFAEDGSLKDKKQSDTLNGIVSELVTMIAKLMRSE